MYEEDFDRMLERQIRTAKGQRLEALRRDKTGEKLLYCEVLRHVLPSMNWILEYEMLSLNGVRIYLDFYCPDFRLAPECVGFVPHAQNLTRDRFDFEQTRIQTMAVHGIVYLPFSWDQLDKKPEKCRRVLYEWMGRRASIPGTSWEALTVYEREVIRYGLYIGRPFKIREVQECTGLKEDKCRQILRNLLEKKMIIPKGKGTLRHHSYLVEPKAKEFMFWQPARSL
ncbi:hypothetical protein [Cohnella caldifontis]|uniref:hypothetical protein n=1 Tax=Cohnella caldifontis TaxID=3027471 RepID=UPI0023EB228F|nr:hypothetical protein [Cohnella sp. YIM B05605]